MRGRRETSFQTNREDIKMQLKHASTLPQMHATVQTQALERDRSWWVSCGVLCGEGAKLTSTMLAFSRVRDENDARRVKISRLQS